MPLFEGSSNTTNRKNRRCVSCHVLFFLPFTIGIASINKRPVLEVDIVLHSIDIIQV